MRSQDLKIGEKYQVGFRGCAKVLETQVLRPGFTNGRKDGVKVKFESGSMTGRETIIGSREITRPWQEYYTDRVHAGKDHQLIQQNLKDLKRYLEAAGIETKSTGVAYQVEHSTVGYLGEIRLTGEGVKALTDLLAGKTGGATESSLGELLGRPGLNDSL